MCFGVFQSGDSSTRRLRIHELLDGVDHVLRAVAVYYDCDYEMDASTRSEIRWFHMGARVHVGVFELVEMPALGFGTYNPRQCKVVPAEGLRQLRAFLVRLFTKVRELHKRGVYHLDIKPENILATQDDYRIIDFGTAIGPGDGQPGFVFCKSAYVDLHTQHVG